MHHNMFSMFNQTIILMLKSITRCRHPNTAVIIILSPNNDAIKSIIFIFYSSILRTIIIIKIDNIYV